MISWSGLRRVSFICSGRMREDGFGLGKRGAQHQKNINPPRLRRTQSRDRLKNPASLRPNEFSKALPKPCVEGSIPSASAKKNPRSPEFRGFFCTFPVGLCFEDRVWFSNDALNVVSGGIRFPWFRLVQHHFSIKKILPGPAICRPREFVTLSQ